MWQLSLLVQHGREKPSGREHAYEMRCRVQSSSLTSSVFLLLCQHRRELKIFIIKIMFLMPLFNSSVFFFDLGKLVASFVGILKVDENWK